MSSELKCIAWCPDDCDVDEAREYVGQDPRDVAKQHAIWMHGQSDPQESYEIRVRATNGNLVHEWDVSVDAEVEISFYASLACPVSTLQERSEDCDRSSLVRSDQTASRVQGARHKALVHVVDQAGQPYGSERRCCNMCGTMVEPGMLQVNSIAMWSEFSEDQRCTS